MSFCLGLFSHEDHGADARENTKQAVQRDARFAVVSSVIAVVGQLAVDGFGSRFYRRTTANISD